MRIMLALLAAIVLGGCWGAQKITEGDKLTADQSPKACVSMSHQLDLIALLVGEQAVAEARKILADLNSNTTHTAKIIGKPEKDLPYTTGNSKDARDQSDKEHSSGIWWKTLGTGVLTAALFIGRALLASKFPFLAVPTERSNDATIAGIAQARAASTTIDGKDMISVSLLDQLLSSEQAKAKVKEWTAEKAKEIEEKLGIDPKLV